MPQRRFLIASSLARLIRKEHSIVGRIVEGYFPARPDRDHFVSIEPGHAYLALAPTREGTGAEERTEVPRSQAEALLAVCVGKLGFECTITCLRSGRQALLQRFIAPGPLDLLSVEFEAGEGADGFAPPAWFGPEVTQNLAYDRGSLARVGIPAPEEIPLSNAMLDELLDTLEESQAADARASDEHTEVTSAELDKLVTGLAEALEVPALQSAPDSEEMSVVRSLRRRKS